LAASTKITAENKIIFSGPKITANFFFCRAQQTTENNPIFGGNRPNF
jgi:hypothetical protein